jgi:DNA modification methylase
MWNLERSHTCPRPTDLLRYLVRSFVKPRGVILDCFLGSGTTALAALHEGRKCIGIEKDENFVNLAIKRLEDYHGAGFVTEVRKQKYKAFKKSKKV